eukprot:GEMP01113200.1.p1 GENE.GEMP01113200.1~~GEMP01113200.1.p1  ORF type:complete len:166 (+),score=28.13 GEMP01113200.1:43-540(+)
MLLPGGVAGVMHAPRSSKTTAPFFTLLALQGLMCITRFCCGDMWGGLVMGIVACMGYLAVIGRTIEVVYLAYYGVMVSINGIFDLMVIGEHYHRGYLDFTHHLPLKHLLAIVVIMLSPFVEFLSGYFSYRLFKEAEESERQPILVNDDRQNFRPFEGQSHKLDDP